MTTYPALALTRADLKNTNLFPNYRSGRSTYVTSGNVSATEFYGTAGTMSAGEYATSGNISAREFVVPLVSIQSQTVARLKYVDPKASVQRNWFIEFTQQLKKLQELPQDWNGYGAERPNAMAVYNARLILFRLGALDYQPNRIVPDAEGGVAIYFFSGPKMSGGSHQRYGSLECMNDGTIVTLMHDRGSKSMNAWEIDSSAKSIDDSLNRIHSFTQ